MGRKLRSISPCTATCYLSRLFSVIFVTSRLCCYTQVSIPFPVCDSWSSTAILLSQCPRKHILELTVRKDFSGHRATLRRGVALLDTMKKAVFILTFVVHSIGPVLTSADGHTVEESKSEILWDTWGIPHIFARNHQELFFAYG